MQDLVNKAPVATEEQNRLFIEHAPAAMAMFDKEMRYLSVSKRWMQEYDLRGNIIGKKHYELFPNILQRWKDVHARCMAGAIEKSDDDHYVKDNGAPVWLKWEVYPWHTATAEIGGIVIFTENITDRKISEQVIKESEERFRTMANEAPLFVWETDEKLQTSFLNKAGTQYFNLDEAAKIAELSWKKYIHPDDLDRVLGVMYKAAANHESYTLEMRLKNGTTGDYRWFLDKASPKYKDDVFTGFIGTSLDIHDSKERDEQKDNFIAMASHELKTPITSIKGYVQVLLSAFENDENKTLSPLLVRSSLISVDKQINRLTRLISELLDLSKIETGTLELKKEKFSLNELAIETIEDIRYTNNTHQINLYHDFHGNVYADKDRIGQAMINFLTNAIKYSPGTLTIDVTISQPAKGEIAYSVRDYGIGIDPSEHGKIFQRFYRAEGKKEKTYPGFGIGLFIASEFVQKHGGRLQLESEKGKGSVFTFMLPVVQNNL